MKLKIVSSVVLALGIVILVVLVVLGVVVKKTIDDTIYDRLTYKLPKGGEQCYRDSHASFDEEYYLWNLTNPDLFLAGAEKPHFNLTGPFSYTLYSCNYGHSVSKVGKNTGILTYHTTYEGYMFLRDDSIDDDSVTITNLNPGYMGILEQLGGDDGALLLVYSGPGLQDIIQLLSSPPAQALYWSTFFASSLNTVTAQSKFFPRAAPSIVSSVVGSASNLFDPLFVNQGIQGWANYTAGEDIAADINVDPAAQQQIYNALADPTTFTAFAAMDENGIALTYSVSVAQASFFLMYIEYLQVMGISASDVTALFDSTSTCSLTNPAGVRTWANITSGGTTVATACPTVAFTLTADQVQLLSVWFAQYLSSSTQQLWTNAGVGNWSDFAWAQWGGSGFSQSFTQYFTDKVPLLEFGLYSPGRPSCKFTVAQAKSLLQTGPRPLFNESNMATLLLLLKSEAFPPIDKIAAAGWPEISSAATAACFVDYLTTNVAPYFGAGHFMGVAAQGGGLVTTRTVREWLFTAQDPLVKVFKPNSYNVGIVGNLTRNKEEAEARPPTTYRVFLGGRDDDELHWSLMPWNENDNVPYWNGTMSITGYNGTQFLPNGYLDADVMEYPLILWHKLINRTVPFKVSGKGKWEGTNIRYLTLSDDALASAKENPYNALYYAEYSGVIDKSTNPPFLPVFLTTPSFLSAEERFKENVTWTDSIYLPSYDPKDKLSTHRYSLFLLVEPLLGSTLWGNLPIQINFEFRPTTIYSHLQGGFAPIYWNAIGDKAGPKDIDTIKSSLYNGQKTWPILIGVGVGVGAVMIAVGIVGLVVYRKSKGERLRVSQG
jgi:hypothetical protein